MAYPNLNIKYSSEQGLKNFKHGTIHCLHLIDLSLQPAWPFHRGLQLCWDEALGSRVLTYLGRPLVSARASEPAVGKVTGSAARPLPTPHRHCSLWESGACWLGGFVARLRAITGPLGTYGLLFGTQGLALRCSNEQPLPRH